MLDGLYCVIFQIIHDPDLIVTGVEGQEEASTSCNCRKEGALRNGPGPCSGRFDIRGQGPKGITCRADWEHRLPIIPTCSALC